MQQNDQDSAAAIDLRPALAALRSGGLIVYPTEAVFGLGCDSRDYGAVARLLALKQRREEPGLISLISDLDQVRPWLDERYREHWDQAWQSWPAAITWLFPCSPRAPAWLTGANRSRIAVRQPAHALCRRLCREFGGPIVSTSANTSGRPPVTEFGKLDTLILAGADAAIDAPCGGRSRPSEIRDLLSDKVIRAG